MLSFEKTAWQDNVGDDIIAHMPTGEGFDMRKPLAEWEGALGKGELAAYGRTLHGTAKYCHFEEKTDDRTFECNRACDWLGTCEIYWRPIAYDLCGGSERLDYYAPELASH